jgi:putative phage-type endonuclease
MLTQEQKEARCYGVGGSDIGVLCGLSPYKTPYELFLSKRIPGEAPYIDNSPISNAARRGNALEPYILDLYEEHSGQPLLARSPEMIYHPSYDFLFANYDGINQENQIVEAKSASSYLKKMWGEPGTSQIPKIYLLQVAHYVEVEDCNYADIIVYFLDDTWAVYRYHRNLAFGQSVLNIAIRFWEENVLKKIAPAPMSTADVIKMFPSPNEVEIIAITDELKETLAEYKSLKAKILMYENEAEAAKVKIVTHMQDHTTLVDQEGYTLATFGFRKAAKRLNTALFQTEEPDLYKKYLNPGSPTRAFIVKQERENLE